MAFVLFALELVGHQRIRGGVECLADGEERSHHKDEPVVSASRHRVGNLRDPHTTKDAQRRHHHDGLIEHGSINSAYFMAKSRVKITIHP